MAAVGHNFQFAALVLGGAGFVVVVAGMYTVIARVARWVVNAAVNVEP